MWASTSNGPNRPCYALSCAGTQLAFRTERREREDGVMPDAARWILVRFAGGSVGSTGALSMSKGIMLESPGPAPSIPSISDMLSYGESLPAPALAGVREVRVV